MLYYDTLPSVLTEDRIGVMDTSLSTDCFGQNQLGPQNKVNCLVSQHLFKQFK